MTNNNNTTIINNSVEDTPETTAVKIEREDLAKSLDSIAVDRVTKLIWTLVESHEGDGLETPKIPIDKIKALEATELIKCAVDIAAASAVHADLADSADRNVTIANLKALALVEKSVTEQSPVPPLANWLNPLTHQLEGMTVFEPEARIGHSIDSMVNLNDLASRMHTVLSQPTP